jgi:hypothetical protein
MSRSFVILIVPILVFLIIGTNPGKEIKMRIGIKRIIIP